jgi:small-conductance mechanosensitive channel/CRP-like cAMP-binding protein
MIPDLPTHAIAAAALLVAVAALRVFTRNRLVRNRLRLTLALLAATLGVEVVLRVASLTPDLHAALLPIGRLLFALSTIHLAVLVLVNPLRVDRIPERFPTIVQDAIIIGLFAIVSTFVLDEKFLTTSAVGAVVVGFALQDTLGNMFSGLAIQVEKPFRVGHWIKAGEHEGSVIEVTWRAIKLRTRHGNLVTVPNSEIAKSPVTNYSEPIAPSRVHVDVGASYAAPPNLVKDTILEVLDQEPQVLKTPAPRVLLSDFGPSSLNYRAQYWIEEEHLDDVIADKVRCGIYYAFSRKGIEIPFPIQVEYSREEVRESDADRATRVEHLLEGVPLFAVLGPEERQALARRASQRLYGRGEAIVRQGEPGSSIFVVASGRVRVTIGPERHEVAVTEAGGYFGEMSLLTGDARSATVLALEDCTVVEITADAFRDVVLANPAVLDTITADVTRRRGELAAVQSAAARLVHGPEAADSLLTRVRRFLLGSPAM